jgi:dTMP kinase
MILKNFIVFEGCDGAGTTTQQRILCEKISSFMTAEPTDGPTGVLIRQILAGKHPCTPETLAFLFAADRNEHLFGENGIVSRCERGEIVVCDRYVLSSRAYQGISCNEELVIHLNERFPAPELLLFFDIDVDTALGRMSTRGAREIFEYQDIQIHVRKRYHALLPYAADAGSRVEIIDASRSIGEVAEQVWRAVQKLPIFEV